MKRLVVFSAGLFAMTGPMSISLAESPKAVQVTAADESAGAASGAIRRSLSSQDRLKPLAVTAAAEPNSSAKPATRKLVDQPTVEPLRSAGTGVRRSLNGDRISVVSASSKPADPMPAKTREPVRRSLSNLEPATIAAAPQPTRLQSAIPPSLAPQPTAQLTPKPVAQMPVAQMPRPIQSQTVAAKPRAAATPLPVPLGAPSRSSLARSESPTITASSPAKPTVRRSLQSNGVTVVAATPVPNANLTSQTPAKPAVSVRRSLSGDRQLVVTSPPKAIEPVASARPVEPAPLPIDHPVPAKSPAILASPAIVAAVPAPKLPTEPTLPTEPKLPTEPRLMPEPKLPTEEKLASEAKSPTEPARTLAVANTAERVDDAAKPHVVQPEPARAIAAVQPRFADRQAAAPALTTYRRPSVTAHLHEASTSSSVVSTVRAAQVAPPPTPEPAPAAETTPTPRNEAPEPPVLAPTPMADEASPPQVARTPEPIMLDEYEPYCESCYHDCYGPVRLCHDIKASARQMYQHHPYEVWPWTYYYFRPYNYRHIAEQQEQAAAWGADPRQPYSRGVFDRVYEDLAKQFDPKESDE